MTEVWFAESQSQHHKTVTFKMRSNSLITDVLPLCIGFPGSSVIKEYACNAGDLGSVPGSGTAPGGGNGYHSSILAWRIPSIEEPGRLQSMGVAESPTTEQLMLTPTQSFQKLKHPSTYIIF